MTDSTPLPSIEQSSPNPPNNCVVIIQNNYIAEGGTINIFSSHCNVSKDSPHDVKAVTRLEHVTATAEPTPLEPPSATHAEAAEHGRGSIVLSSNTFGSPNCTGAVKQTALASQIDRNI
ncbi:hypothetical protein BDR07DRAFT_1382597 [Suillus spraguei]|nr:hypothetical protein BDR07DRAFT_1382597 [Suillus spraguei]